MSMSSASQSFPSTPNTDAVIVNVPPASASAMVAPDRTSQPLRLSVTRSEVWDVPFDHLTLGESIDAIGQLIQHGHPSYLITANLNYVMLHHRDEAMQDITANASLILADGQPIVWRSRLDKQSLPERVAGSEMIFNLAERAAAEGWGIYFLGGMPGVAGACANRLQEQYPSLIVSGIESPPFRQLTASEQQEQDERIRHSGAKLLLVAFGQPKGEKWIHENHVRLGVPVSIQLGASFDFIAGTATRAPVGFQKVGLEWAYRMFSDPKRLIPRYWANATFLAGALLRDWQRTVSRWGMGNWEQR